MRKLIGFGTILGTLAFAAGCSDDSGKTVTPSTDAGTPVVDSGTQPTVDAGTPAVDSGTQPTVDASATDAAVDAAVDAGPATCPTGAKPQATFKGNTDLGNGQSEQTTNITLTADKDWELDGQVFIKSGATLTIEPCVTVKGKVGTAATIVVKPGAKIMAKGEESRPIVFTSGAATKRPGDVGGIIVLGRAPVNQAAPTIEGLPVSAETTFGGTVADDNSGVIEYVRLEYGGVKLGANNEINGLTLGGVGSGTSIHHVQVRHTLDDCFEFFGGTVNAHHLVCTSPQDDGFDWDWGFSGKLQHLVLQQGTFDDEMNGFEADNDAQGTDASPVSNPTISNVTLCGRDMAPGAKKKFGMLLRRNTGAKISNVVAYGFDYGIDVRDAKTHARANGTMASGPNLAVTSSLFFKFTGAAGTDAAFPTGTATNPAIGFNETSTTEKAFNEFNWVNAAAASNVLDTDPQLAACKDPSNPSFNAPAALYGSSGVLITKAAVTTGMPDANAKYIGAFKDASDKWATTGTWVKWTPEGQ
jgi:hypothetical protein